MKGREWIEALEKARGDRDRAGMLRALGTPIEGPDLRGKDWIEVLGEVSQHRMWAAVLYTYRNMFGWWAEEKVAERKASFADLRLVEMAGVAAKRMEAIMEAAAAELPGGRR